MTLALTIRQPWAWLIAKGHKNIENRSWTTRHRGPLLIHAGMGMSSTEYEVCAVFAEGLGVKVPPFNDLLRGGIVGYATLVNCVTWHTSPWFVGPTGWLLADAKPLPFTPCGGAQRLFNSPISLEEILRREAAGR